jgi:hypothetical protein
VLEVALLGGVLVRPLATSSMAFSPSLTVFSQFWVNSCASRRTDLPNAARCSPASPTRLIVKIMSSGAMIALPPPLSSRPVICAIWRVAGSLATILP